MQMSALSVKSKDSSKSSQTLLSAGKGCSWVRHGLLTPMSRFGTHTGHLFSKSSMVAAQGMRGSSVDDGVLIGLELAELLFRCGL